MGCDKNDIKLPVDEREIFRQMWISSAKVTRVVWNIQLRGVPMKFWMSFVLRKMVDTNRAGRLNFELHELMVWCDTYGGKHAGGSQVCYTAKQVSVPRPCLASVIVVLRITLAQGPCFA